MKKYFSKLIIIMQICIIILNGCGISNNSQLENKSDITIENTQNSSRNKLTVMSWWGETAIKPILDAFKAKYPGVEIEFQHTNTDSGQYNQKLMLLANSGELPDVFNCSFSVRKMAKNDFFADITDLEAVKRLPAKYKDYYAYNGRVYAYPAGCWVGGVFYNKELFEKYNLSQPKTWTEFLNICKIFKRNGIRPISMRDETIPDLVYLLHMTGVLSKDTNIDLKIGRGEATFSKGYLDTLKLWDMDYVKTGIISKDLVEASESQRINEFATGKAAMIISGPWIINSIKRKNPNLKFSIMPFPGKTEGNEWAIGALDVPLAISSDCKNIELAKAFLNFYGSNQGLKLFHDSVGSYLLINGINYDVDPIMKPIRSFLESGKFAFPPSDWDNNYIAPLLLKGMQEIILGVSTPEKVSKEIDQKILDIVKK